MIDSQDYTDWCLYAGLYLKNHSHADRYRTYEQKISEAGLVTRIVHDFIHDMDDVVDLTNWRSYSVYETGKYLKYRIEKTVFALQTIGATRVAEKIPTAKNRSPMSQLMQARGNLEDAMQEIDPAQAMQDFRNNLAKQFPEIAAQAGYTPTPSPPTPIDPDIETLTEINALLEAYVTSHQEELQADLDRLGDPRQDPDFDPQRRLQELEEQRLREAQRESQLEAIQALKRQMKEFARLYEKVKGNAAKLASHRRELIDLYDKYAEDQSDLLPKLKDCLAECKEFQQTYRDIFHPQITEDPALQKRLDNYGPYSIDEDFEFGTIRVSWSKPPAFRSNWTDFNVDIEFQPGEDQQISLLLDATSRLQSRFPSLSDELQQEIVGNFSEYWDWMEEDEKEEYDIEFDDAGVPVFDSLKPCIGIPGINLTIPEWPDGDAIAIDGYLAVDWDCEHGLMFEWEDVPETVETPAAKIPEHVQFTDAGPQLTPADIIQFETEHKIELPQLYREFLLQTNGGKPVPNHLQLKSRGTTTPIDFDSFSGINAENPEMDLGTVLSTYHTYPYLPIARIKAPDQTNDSGQMQYRSNFLLFLNLTEPHQNQIAFTTNPLDKLCQKPSNASNRSKQKKSRFANFFYGPYIEVLAPDIFSLLIQLTERPVQKLPVWLEALRNQDQQQFLEWVGERKTLRDQYVEYGYHRNWSVLDYVAAEAPPEFILDLIKKNYLVPEKLLASWGQSDRSIERFQELMTVLSPQYWRYVFLSPEVWDHPDILNTISNLKIDLNTGIAPDGGTPLQQAVRTGSPDNVRWLMEQGASLSKPDNHGKTALDYAESLQHLDCLIALLEAGAPLETLFPRLPDMNDKLTFLKTNWGKQFPKLLACLKHIGIDTSSVEE